MAGKLDLKYQLEHEETVDGIVYRLATSEEDLDFIVDLYYNDFLPDEPATNLIDPTPKQPNEAMTQQMRDIVRHGVSLVALEEKTGRRVGMRTAMVQEREEAAKESKLSLSDYKAQNYPDYYANFFVVADQVFWAKDMFDLHPEANRLYYMYTLGCIKELRGRGIASQLIKQAFKVARKVGCEGAIVLSTNVLSRKIFDKLEMDRVKEVHWKDVVINGKPVCPPSNMVSMTSHYKRL